MKKTKTIARLKKDLDKVFNAFIRRRDAHENRITQLEAFKNRKEDLIESHETDIKEHRELIGRLEVSVSKITK